MLQSSDNNCPRWNCVAQNWYSFSGFTRSKGFSELKELRVQTRDQWRLRYFLQYTTKLTHLSVHHLHPHVHNSSWSSHSLAWTQTPRLGFPGTCLSLKSLELIDVCSCNRSQWNWKSYSEINWTTLERAAFTCPSFLAQAKKMSNLRSLSIKFHKKPLKSMETGRECLGGKSESVMIVAIFKRLPRLDELEIHNSLGSILHILNWHGSSLEKLHIHEELDLIEGPYPSFDVKRDIPDPTFLEAVAARCSALRDLAIDAPNNTAQVSIRFSLFAK
jgi:hypothetical protein